MLGLNDSYGKRIYERMRRQGSWPWPDPLANPVARASASSAGLNTMACPVDPIDPVDRIPWE